MNIKFLRISIFFIAHMLMIYGKPVNKWYSFWNGTRIFIEPQLEFNWFKAWNECANKNMNLIALDSMEKSEALTAILKKHFGQSRNIWLGGHDLADEGNFIWSATGKRFEFTNWAGPNPDNLFNIEHCVHIWDRSDYEWNDATCKQKMGFICEERGACV
ncbi:lectin subunit alpha-like [Haematobia irritans]|uniref:lectin subunit alpha-like n=1 Tax=Haematobia irritans TaxID=7368 RepID=UPI003F5015EE